MGEGGVGVRGGWREEKLGVCDSLFKHFQEKNRTTSGEK